MQHEIKFTNNTMIILNYCDNNRFKDEYLIPFLKTHKLSYVNCFNFNNSDDEDKLKELRQLSSYPINVNIILVELCEEISKHIVDEIISISHDNHYSLVSLHFDFDKVKYFHSKKKMNNFHLKTDNFEKYSITFESKASNYQPIVSTYDNYCVVGDIHGCYKELIECVTDNKGIVYNSETNELTHPVDEYLEKHYYHHILLGDYLDKNSDENIRKTIEFIYQNRAWFWIVKGNHENFAYKFLNHELGSYEENKHLIDSEFISIKLLEKDEALRKKFFTLFESSYNFILTDNFIVTHSPCEQIYLGKDDSISERKQRNLIYPKREDFESHEAYLKAFKEIINFLYTEANEKYPFHVFGHIAFENPFIYKNKIGIDTGCAVGNKLTSVLLRNHGKEFEIKSCDSMQPKSERINNLIEL